MEEDNVSYEDAPDEVKRLIATLEGLKVKANLLNNCFEDQSEKVASSESAKFTVDNALDILEVLEKIVTQQGHILGINPRVESQNTSADVLAGVSEAHKKLLSLINNKN